MTRTASKKVCRGSSKPKRQLFTETPSSAGFDFRGVSFLDTILRWFLAVCVAVGLSTAMLAHAIDRNDYVLGPADHVKISVYEYPDMTTEARISENGKIRFPLIGEVVLGGLTVQEAEARIAEKLRSGNFVLKPQVNLLVTSFRSQTVSVLGQVNRAGQYPVDRPSRLSDMLALAGGIAPNGADTIVVTRTEGGKTARYEIDQNVAFGSSDVTKDIAVRGGDVIFVPRQQQFYIHGEVTRPGYYRLESGMTLAQALAAGGGVTQRGSERSVKVTRKDDAGKTVTIDGAPDMIIRPDDVIFGLVAQFYVFGEVQRPGSFRIERNLTVTQALSLAGGVTQRGSERSIKLTRRDAAGTKVVTREALPIELLQADDVVYVNQTLFYIYGEVQRPGQFRVEPGMTFVQALATGGGITARGTDRGIRVSRRDDDGKVKTFEVNPNDPVLPDDVIYVKERLF